MTKPLTKEDLIRSAWITELRRQGHRKCESALCSGTRVCALGLLVEVAGRSPQSLTAYEICQESADLTWAQLDEIWKMNDGTTDVRVHTFSEIADVVESWFKP